MTSTLIRYTEYPRRLVTRRMMERTMMWMFSSVSHSDTASRYPTMARVVNSEPDIFISQRLIPS